MKTKTIFLSLLTLLFAGFLRAQDRTTVTATSSDISDNLDLRAVASIFGDSRDLEDFERRINDPKAQISNLDLNGDGNVDYLRVVETHEDNASLIVLQAVLDKDVFQDVATIEVQRSGNNVQVQVVGDPYMYGPNYIYEPIYVTRPVIYDVFWTPYYRPYYSPYYYGYYPTYYSFWRPYPVYRYRRNVNVFINVHNHYNYVTVNRNTRAYQLYSGRRANGYEVRNPGRSFVERTNMPNKREFDQGRREAVRANGGVRNNGATSVGTRANNSVRGNDGVRTNNGVRTNTNTGVRNDGPVRANNQVRTDANANTPRPVNTTPRANSNPVRTQNLQPDNAPVRVETPSPRPQAAQPVRSDYQSTPRTQSAQPVRSEMPAPRQSAPVQQAPRVQSAPVQQSAPRMQSAQPVRQMNAGGGGRAAGGQRGGRN